VKKLLIALMTIATIAALVLATSGAANARWAGRAYATWGAYRGWFYPGRHYRPWGYPGWHPRIIAIAGVYIGGPLAAGYFYPVGYSRYPSYFGPGIYGSGFCVLIACYGWPGGCY
jgi:hypothetical protein